MANWCNPVDYVANLVVLWHFSHPEEAAAIIASLLPPHDSLLQRGLAEDVGPLYEQLSDHVARQHGQRTEIGNLMQPSFECVPATRHPPSALQGGGFARRLPVALHVLMFHALP